MLFAEKIRELRMNCQLPQRSLAAALGIDTATYCKIEKGERRARKDQLAVLSNIFHEDIDKLRVLWLADKVTEVVSNDKPLAEQAFLLAAENLKRAVYDK